MAISATATPSTTTLKDNGRNGTHRHSSIDSVDVGQEFAVLVVNRERNHIATEERRRRVGHRRVLLDRQDLMSFQTDPFGYLIHDSPRIDRTQGREAHTYNYRLILIA